MFAAGLAIPYLLVAVFGSPPDVYDLSPYYLQDERVERAYEAFKRGERDTAEAGLRAYLETAPPAEMGRPARYLLTRVLAQRWRRARGRAKRALARARIAELGRLVGWKAMSGNVRAELALLFEGLDEPQKARQQLAAIPPGGRASSEVRLRMAQISLEDGHFGAALARLKALETANLSASRADQVVILKAQALAGLGKKKTAVTVLRRLWVRRFGRKGATAAARALRALGRAPRQADEVTLRFAKRRRGKRRSLMKRIRKLRQEYKHAGRAAWEFARGVVWSLDEKTRAKGLALLRRAAKRRDPFVRGYALRRIARIQRQADEDGAAIQTLKTMADGLRQHPEAPQALLDAAGLAERLGKRRMARKLLATLSARYPQHPARAEALWRQGWLAFRGGEFRDAKLAFDRLVREAGTRRTTGHATWGERGLYWRGRAEAASGELSRALGTWSYVVSRYPLTYYSHLAYNRIASHDAARVKGLRPLRTLSPWTQASLVDVSKLQIKRSEALDGAVALFKMGLFEDARAELEVGARAGRLDAAGLTFLLGLALRQRRFRESSGVIRWRGNLPTYPDWGGERLWRLAYPLPWLKWVKASAAEAGISPWLLMAVIRHESRYEPGVVSRSGAIGLTQMLLGTAKAVARKLFHETPPTRRRLKDPATNIRLGARLLGESMTHFGQNEALVLAAYNAGAGRARGWLRKSLAASQRETDVWVEEIPYPETRSYVASILGTYGVYRYLYGSREVPENRSIPLELALPERLGPYFGRAAESLVTP